jgi:hypothetical protein
MDPGAVEFEWSALGGQNGAGSTCVSLAKSHVHDVHTTLILGTNNSLVDSNEFDHFGEDAIDYVANHIAITHNDIHDPMDYGIAAHSDAMQGYPGVSPAAGVVPGYNTFTDILIDSNHIQRVKDAANPLPYFLQGIDNYNCAGTLLTKLTEQCHFDASMRRGLFQHGGECHHRGQHRRRRRNASIRPTSHMCAGN